jgi:RHS repeat-associated protein
MTRRKGNVAQNTCALTIAALMAGAATIIPTGPANGEYWVAGLPPLGGTNSVTCSDGFACARINQAAFYGTDIKLKDCYYTYGFYGAKTGAACLGETWGAGFARNGYSGLVCQSGEFNAGSGCITKPPVDKAPRCQPAPKGTPAPNTVAGNPVDTRSGIKTEYALDYSTEGASPLKFERHYTSNSDYIFGRIGEARLGRGWRSNFDAAIDYTGNPSSGAWMYHVRLPNGTQYMFDAGVQKYFNWSTKWWATGSLDGVATLAWNSPAQRYELKTSDDTLWSFDYTGKLRTIKYRDGYAQELSYDANGYNNLVQDSFGRQLTFTYTAQGLLSTMTVPGGKTYKYEYLGRYDATVFNTVATDDIGRMHWALEYVTLPDDTTDANDNPKVRYHYENTSFPFALTGITDEKGVRWATWLYDTSGRVTSSEHANGVDSHTFSYDNTAHTVTVTNPLTKQTKYHFTTDARGLHRLSQVEGLASANCAASNTTFGYDSNGFVNQTTDGEGRVTQRVNNSRGLPTSVTRGHGTPSAVTTTYTWHSTLAVPTQIVEPGLTTTLTWNTAGQLTQRTETDTTTHSVPYSTNGQTRTWTYTYGTGGLLLTVDGPLSGTGDTVTYTYNTLGFLASVTNEVGHVTQFTAWNGRGQPMSMTDPNGVVSDLTYDALGRLKTITVDSGGVAALTSFDYDAVGQVTKITRPNGAYLQYTWDNARRLTKVEDNTGASIEYDRDNMGNVTARRIKNSGGTTLLSQTATFDELGRLLTFVGAANQTWTYGYDKTDNRTSVTDPRSNLYQYAFDPLNVLIRETDEDSEQVNLTRNGQDEITTYSDPRSLATNYVRNGFGDIIQRASPDSGTTVYEYNALGKVTKITDGRGVVTDMTYDNAGRLLTKSYPAATAENIAYAWDSTTGGNKGVGRITGITDASGSIAWTYDALGRITQETKTTASVAYTVGYAYDADGNVTQITYPSGRIVTYARDSLGRISGVTTKKDASSATVTLASDVAYQPFGPLQSLTYGNGLTLWKTFTSDYLLDVLLVEDPSIPQDIISRAHTRTDDLNLTNIWDNVSSTRNESYWYTATNRLQNADGIWGALTYYYDGVGNRTHEILDDGTSTTTSVLGYPSGSNRVASVTHGSTTVRSFTHDGAGNITADDRAGTVYDYRYNKRGRLDQVSVGTQVRADYVYDALERLALRTTQNMTPSGTTPYVYDRAGRLLVEAGPTGTTFREYVWLDGMPLALVADVDTSTPKLWFVHADHLERPIKMTDETKAVVWDAVYRPFGEVHSITGTASNNLRFPGQYFLIEAGLHYNWHRHYDPTLGRYLQTDPLEFVDGPSVYAYANSAPAVKADPDGRQIVIPRPGPNATPVPPGVFDEWRKLHEKGIKGLLQACLRIIQGSGGGNKDDPDDCRKEWEDAREMCSEELAKQNPSRGITGGYRDVENCARGLVSERCGGNRVDRSTQRR